MFVSNHCLGLLLSLVLFNEVVECQRIAIIGEGISGSFTAKYLSDYDIGCKSETITIFEAVPIDGPLSVKDVPEGDWQGSRVTSVKLSNGINIELGASIALENFHLVLEMIRNDPSLKIGPPFQTGVEDPDEIPSSMGIYLGNQKWAFRTWSGWKMFNKFMLLFRFNFDLINLAKLLKQFLNAFDTLPTLLSSTMEGTFFESPDQLWDRLGFLPAVHASFSVFLDAAKISTEPEFVRRFLPFQGSLRDELLTAINLVNYNQNNDQVNGLVGLGSFAASSGNLFSIQGGNHGVIRSAVEQAKNSRTQLGCVGKIHQISKRITHVIASLDGLHLLSDGEELGHFDAVVLAAPLHQARIQFMVQSQFDAAVLQPMPLGGLIDTEQDAPPDHEGHTAFPGFLPDAAYRPYTQVVTTVVSQAKLQVGVLGLEGGKSLPRILFTESGKSSLHNITAITQIHSSGVYKIFSNEPLADHVKKTLFGATVHTEYTKVWGGSHGGATPDYQGKGESTGFLLYDAAVGLSGHTKAGALYYPIAMEMSSLACIEISAIGAKAVAKLIAQRFGWIKVDGKSLAHDEL